MNEAKNHWDTSFKEQSEAHAYNTAPVESVIRSVSYFLRDQTNRELSELRFLELGCGAGPNLLWMAKRGLRVSGIDISSEALKLAKRALKEGNVEDRVEQLLEGSVTQTSFPSESFDGIVEACVFQHLNKTEREKAFSEVGRLLKKGGLFVGYMLDRGHSIFERQKSEESSDDPGTLMLSEGGSKFHLNNLGVSHFYSEDEIRKYLRSFSLVDPSLSTYYIPKHEARKRGFDSYLQSMWIVYAIK